jgi:hypothetical protein
MCMWNVCYIWCFFGSLLQLLDFPSVSRPDWWSKQWLILFLCLGGNMVFELGNVLPLVNHIFSLKWDPWSRRATHSSAAKDFFICRKPNPILYDWHDWEWVLSAWKMVFGLWGVQEYYYGNIRCSVPQFWWGKYLQYLRQTTFESVLWNQGSTICVEEKCYHTQDGIFMGHVTVPQTHPLLFLLIMCSWKFWWLLSLTTVFLLPLIQLEQLDQLIRLNWGYISLHLSLQSMILPGHLAGCSF